MNSINITGRTTDNIDVKMTQSGISVASFTLAVKRPRVKDTTDFIECVAWRESADFLGKYIGKGDLVGVTGTLTTRTYEGSDGKKHKVTEVLCDRVEALNTTRSNEQSNYPPAPQNAPQTAQRSPSQTYLPDAYNPQTNMDQFAPLPGDDDLPF